MNKRILITGGAGFIGSNLCEKLLNDGHKIICVDNLFTGNIKNIEYLLKNNNFKFINHNIIDYLQLDGEPEISPQHENYRGNVNTVGIRSCYDEGKRVAETLIMEYHSQYNVDTRIARIFNTYGPKMDKNDGRVVSNLINQALNNCDLTLYGNGEQTRSFCYIDDQIDGLIKLMNSDYIHPVNIGNPYEINMKQLATIILNLTKSKSNIIYKELPSDDPTNRKPDITKAKKILNWDPKYDLEKGLMKTIKYFSEIL